MSKRTELVAARGTKRTCLTCSTRFYDLGRDPIVCPSCGAGFDATDPADAPPGMFERIAVKPGWRRPGPAARSAPVTSRDDVAENGDVAASQSVEEIEPDETADEAILETEDADDSEAADLVDAPDEVDRD